MIEVRFCRRGRLGAWFAALGLSFVLPACGDGDGDSGNDPDTIEIAGDWSGEFGDESISSDTWSGQSVVRFDNADNVAVTQNAADAMFDPDKFNKLVWTDVEANSFYYCTVAFGLDTAELAEASTETADASDPENGGCGDFPWTQLTRVEP